MVIINSVFPRFAYVVCLLLASGCSKQREPDFAKPSACYYDEALDVYLVGNVNGAPVDKDDNGFILRVSPTDGSRTEWISGLQEGITLHAPRGMTIAGDVLWVADIDVLRKFDRISGALLGNVEIEGATFLSGVSSGPDGSIYCTDAGLDGNFEATGSDAIWRVTPDGKVAALIKSTDLGQPMGIVARGGGVYVVSWRDGAFFEIDYRGVRTDLGVAPQKHLHGLVRVDQSSGRASNQKLALPSWYASSWEGNAVYRFEITGGVTAMPLRLEEAASLGHDSRRNCLVIPLSGSDRLLVEQL